MKGQLNTFIFILAILVSWENTFAKEFKHKNFLELVNTRFTHVDYDNDGRVDVIRSYKEKHFDLKSVTYFEYGEKTIRRHVDFSALPHTIVKTSEILTKANLDSPGIIIKKEVENFSAPEVLKESITYIAENEDGNFNKKIVLTYDHPLITETVSMKKGKLWAEKDQQSLPSIIFSRKRTSRDRKESRKEQRKLENLYTSCLKKQNGNEPSGECLSALLGSPIDNIDSFLAPNFTVLTCVADEEIFLPSGFRIDTKTCGKAGSPAVRMLEFAAKEVTEFNMQCLATINPEFAKDCAEAFVEKRPKFKCAQNYPGDGSIQENFLNGHCGSNSKCRKTYINDLSDSSGFYSPQHKNDIYLTAMDPNNSQYFTPQDMREPIPEEASRYPDLVNTIFHEMLHSCGHPGGKNHNHPHFDDEVYGCMGLCGGDASRLSKEGCNKCLTSSGNRTNKGSANLKFCNQFPKESILRPLYESKYLDEAIKGCISLTSNQTKSAKIVSECKKALSQLSTNTLFPNICKRDINVEDNDEISSCVNSLISEFSNKVRTAGRNAGNVEELHKALKLISNKEEIRFSITKNAKGELQLYEPVILEADKHTAADKEKRYKIRAFNMLKSISLGALYGFCNEIEGKNEKQVVRIKKRYHSDLSVRFSPMRIYRKSFPWPVFAEDVSSEQSQKRCEDLKEVRSTLWKEIRL